MTVEAPTEEQFQYDCETTRLIVWYNMSVKEHLDGSGFIWVVTIPYDGDTGRKYEHFRSAHLGEATRAAYEFLEALKEKKP